MKRNTTITAVLAAGSTDSPYTYLVTITQPVCGNVDGVIFTPQITYVQNVAAGEGAYLVTLRAEGVATFGGCATRSAVIAQNFNILVVSATAPTAVTLAQGATTNTITSSACGNTMTSNTAIAVTIA